MKTAIITDSNSGITQEKAKQLGIYVVPMPFTIDGKEYEEDINLSQDDFYHMLEHDCDIITSQPSPVSITTLWDKLLTDYDAIIHIPMSSGLSGSCQTAYMLSQDDKYEGKVYIIDNQRISVTQMRSALDAKAMADTGMNADEIAKTLMDTKLDATIYITVDTLKYLKKGGRITPAAAALGTLLRIKPVLTIQGEKLDAWAKARTMKQAKTMMIGAVKKDLEERFGDTDGSKTHIYIAHTHAQELAEEYAAEVRQIWPQAEVIEIAALSLSVSCHIGAGSLALAASKKIEL